MKKYIRPETTATPMETAYALLSVSKTQKDSYNPSTSTTDKPATGGNGDGSDYAKKFEPYEWDESF